MNFFSTDVKWIKSVTRDNGKAWAYLGKNVGDTFDLNFSKNPKWYPTNYKKAKPTELMVLFQTYHEQWYVTHLVSPVDDTIGLVDNEKHPYTRLVVVVGVNDKPTQIDPEVWSFYKCSRGQICDIKTIEPRDESILSVPQKQHFIWNLFKNIDASLIDAISKFNSDLEEDHVTEGEERTILKIHKYKERDSGIIKRAKQKAKQEKRFFCEACKFNFEIKYPELGYDFIECHHKTPISLGGLRKTHIDDLAIVCANCHRMLHRKSRNGNYLTVEELKLLIDTTLC